MPSILRQFKLPDLISMSSAFPDATNPHWKRVSAESREWVNSYRVFSDQQRLAFFTSGQSELLCSYAYPYAGYDAFRACCDFVNLLFVLDEVSDEQTADDAWSTGRVFLNVLNNPDWDDGSKVAQMTRDLRTRLVSTGIKPNTFRRLLTVSRDYIASVVQEAGLRERGEVLDIDSYIELRRNNSAVIACFALIPYCLGIDLPDEVVEDTEFIALNMAAVDMVCWANDIYSYDMEQAKGLEGNNIMTVLTEVHGMTMQEASDHVGEQYRLLMENFLKNKAALRSFGPMVDTDVRRYVDAVRHWPRGNLSWSFDTPRYFGGSREQVKRSLVVLLKPRAEPKHKTQDDLSSSTPVSV